MCILSVTDIWGAPVQWSFNDTQAAGYAIIGNDHVYLGVDVILDENPKESFNLLSVLDATTGKPEFVVKSDSFPQLVEQLISAQQSVQALVPNPPPRYCIIPVVFPGSSKVLAFDIHSNEKLVWSLDLPGVASAVSGAVAEDSNETVSIYVAQSGARLSKVSWSLSSQRNGSIVWTYASGWGEGTQASRVAVFPNAKVVLFACPEVPGNLWALNTTNGGLLYIKSPKGNMINYQMVDVASNSVAVALAMRQAGRNCFHFVVHAFDPSSGKNIWNYTNPTSGCGTYARTFQTDVNTGVVLLQSSFFGAKAVFLDAASGNVLWNISDSNNDSWRAAITLQLLPGGFVAWPQYNNVNDTSRLLIWDSRTGELRADLAPLLFGIKSSIQYSPSNQILVGPRDVVEGVPDTIAEKWP